MTEYHWDDKVYTDYKEFQKVIVKDWYNRYNKYMIQNFFYIGRKFGYDGIVHEVLENYAEVSETKGWLYLKALGKNSYKAHIHPRKILKKEPSLRAELDQMLQGVEFTKIELYEQIELF
ncbi:hypothetical protein [Bacillus pseudomycoides]|uniref:hypothetical protein n=1 Tax=Bacillus pseudomycoides TaxID=64104 RepID=UPI0005005788|nr:hypothetical protein [Bacillus pseudomycoides]KFN13734.1 hypothetical protein DJ94_4512 [Bacillus pseudomycoides]MDR4188111.1 hypothetical protein [Bacillus pseudomycoides]MED0856358.1 hypothetical protein [Bacillus pseudomycoides]PEK70418.1 hypothetical protein CN593_05210 [Bacillus pseudomycoides]PEN08599.1 hypothetical protein CN640_13250 [Bacillus pseudomycoides]